MGRIKRHWKGLLASIVALVVVLAVGIPFVYIHFIQGDPPKKLSLAALPSDAASGAPVTTVEGTWTVGRGSSAGYRVPETLAGQKTTAVGRTIAVSGSLTVSGTSVSAASFTVQLAKVTSDESRRDSQFTGRIMDTAKYPTGTFKLTDPIALGSIPAVGKTVSAKATGKLTLHGTTRTVTFPLQAKRTASQIAVTGDIPITYGDYGIDNPSFGSFVSVGTGGTIEFLLVTTKS